MDKNWVKGIASKMPQILSEAFGSAMDNLGERVSADGILTNAQNVTPPTSEPAATARSIPTLPAPPPAAPTQPPRPPTSTPVTYNQAPHPPAQKSGTGKSNPTTRQPPPLKRPPANKFKQPRNSPFQRQPQRNPPHAPAVANIVGDEWEIEPPSDVQEEEELRRRKQFTITNRCVVYSKPGN